MSDNRLILTALRYHIKIIEAAILKLWHTDPRNFSTTNDAAMLTDYGGRAIRLTTIRAAIIQTGVMPSDATSVAIIIDSLNAYIGHLKSKQIDNSNAAEITLYTAELTRLSAL